MNTLRDRPAQPRSELDIGPERGDDPGVAVELKRGAAGAEAVPAAAQLDPALNRHPQIGVLVEHLRQQLRLARLRLHAARRRRGRTLHVRHPRRSRAVRERRHNRLRRHLRPGRLQLGRLRHRAAAQPKRSFPAV